MRAFQAGALVLVGSGAPCMAQVDGQATWLWEVMTEDGDAVVEPGETATVTLSIDMEPDVSFPNGPVLGLAAALFNTLGGDGAANGHVEDWLVLNDLDSLTGDLTTTNGVDLFGTFAGQIAFTDNFTPEDPINILEFTWAPDTYAAYSVRYMTYSFFVDPPAEHMIIVWEGDGADYNQHAWTVEEGAVSFQVVPAPGAMAVFATMGSPMCRRRRSPGLR